MPAPTFRYRNHMITVKGSSVRILRVGQDDDKATCMEVTPQNSRTLDVPAFARQWVDVVEAPKLVQP